MSITVNDSLRSRGAEEVSRQPEWYGQMSKEKIEQLLRGKDKFTYILSSSDSPNKFNISFVAQDNSIQHKVFTYDDPVFQYRNGDLIRKPNFQALFPKMLNCSEQECRPLKGAFIA